MKKVWGILIVGLGLLLSSCAGITHPPSTYNQVFKATPEYIDIGIDISMKIGPAGVNDPGTKRMAINHCSSYKKFTYALKMDSVSKLYDYANVYRFSCFKRQVYKQIYWTNYDPTKKWEDDSSNEDYKP